MIKVEWHKEEREHAKNETDKERKDRVCSKEQPLFIGSRKGGSKSCPR